MDSFELAFELRKVDAWSQLPVVVITARDLTEEKRSRLETVVQDMVNRSAYRQDDLVRIVKNVIGYDQAGIPSQGKH